MAGAPEQRNKLETERGSLTPTSGSWRATGAKATDQAAKGEIAVKMVEKRIELVRRRRPFEVAPRRGIGARKQMCATCRGKR
jgi:hypothetical protein